MPSFIDLTGQRFGRLKVIERAPNHIQPCGKSKVLWKCICDCGNEICTDGYGLRKGMTKSCGCYGKEQRIKANTIHGMSRSRLAKIYANMRSRCYNPNASKYEIYGGKGIKICDEWLNDRTKFFDWAVNNGYKEDLTIDRIDPNKDYEPNNCIWATVTEQNNHLSNAHFIDTPFGNITIVEYSRKLNAPYNLVYGMLYRGHTVEEVFNRFYKEEI